MSYVKAKDVLRDALLEAIQSYIEGEYIYIPRKENSRKEWGETTSSKQVIYNRNSEIYTRYKAGVSVKSLAQLYYLSPKSIQRIILYVYSTLNKAIKQKGY